MESKCVILLLGIAIGFAIAQLRNEKCGDGRICWCSQSTQIISCVDSRLMNVPSFSSRIRNWVRRLNLRFNHIIDLNALLRQDFPKLIYVDVRDNQEYLCNEVHDMLIARGTIIESHCSHETTMIIHSIHPKSTTLKLTSKPMQFTTPKPENDLKQDEKKESIGVDVSGRVECDMTFALSFTAVGTSIATSIIGFIVNHLCKKYRKKTIKINKKLTARFNEPRPSVSRPLELFKDLSDQKNKIYKGPLSPESFINSSYSSNPDIEAEEQIYEIPIPTRSAPSAPPPPPLQLPTHVAPTPQNVEATSSRGKAPLSGKARPIKSSAASKGRGRGKEAIGLGSISVIIDDKPPAKNTRSQTRNTTHM